jgi:predicted RNA binding protein YcfA (HicA-like mRNA interferase family)
MKHPRISHDMKDIRRALIEQGWRVEKTNGQHIRCVPPDKNKPIVVTGSTPSDIRAIRNFISDLRHSGFREAAA